MRPAELTLVICTRDRPADVFRAAATALRLSPASIRLIVVDQSEGSSTRTALAPLFGDSRLVYCHSPALGLGAARNRGVREAAGELVAFTDDDCEIQPGFCESLVEALIADERIGIVFGSVVAGPHDSQKGFIPAYAVTRAFTARSLADKHRAEGIGACMGLRRSVWQQLGGFDERLGAGTRFKAAEDTDLAIRCLAHGRFVHEAPTVAVLHHGFRTWDEGKVLIPGYLYGIGATFGKHAACGRLAVLQVAARLAVRWAFSGPAVEFGHRPPRLSRLLAFGRGFWDAIRTPVDRRTTLFSNPGAIPAHEAANLPGRLLTLPRILAVALLLRLAVPGLAVLTAGEATPLLNADSREYLALGEGLARGGVFENDGGAELYRLPGYPLMVALASLFGYPIGLTIVFQALLGTAVVALCHRLALCCGPANLARLAALACALDPLQILWGSMVMAETLLTLLVTLSVLGALRFYQEGSGNAAALAAFAAATAVVVKPVAVLLPAWLSLLFLFSMRGGRRANALRAAALAFLLGAVPVAAWTARNGLCCGAWTFTLQAGHALRTAAYWTAASRDPRPYEEKREALSAELLDADPQRARTQVVDRATLENELRAAPGSFLVVHLRGLFRTLFHPGALAWRELFLGQQPATTAVSLSIVRDGSRSALLAHADDLALMAALAVLAAATAPTVVLALLAALRLRRPGSQATALLLAVSAYFVLLGGGAWGQSRLRVPIMPLFCVLAAGEALRLFRGASPAGRAGSEAV